MGFHTRGIGFVPVATHKHGDLNCQSRRITLLLDLKSSYHRLKARGKWVYRHLTANWPPPCTVALPRDSSANRLGQHEIEPRRHGARPEEPVRLGVARDRAGAPRQVVGPTGSRILPRRQLRGVVREGLLRPARIAWIAPVVTRIAVSTAAIDE